MKINCNYSKGNGCQNCMHQPYCSLLKPTNKNHSMLLSEIGYWMKKLRQARENLAGYEEVWSEIRHHKYSVAVNVYGNIQYAPKQNALGVFIRRPEHVYYGWSLSRLLNEKEKLTEHIRVLNRKEFNMRKILERRKHYG